MHRLLERAIQDERFHTVRMPAANRMPASALVGTFAICVGVILGPLALGATFPWPRLGVEALMTLAILCWIASGRASRVAALIPIAIVAVFLLQLVPLPNSLLMRLSPLSGAAWKVANPMAWGTVAVDPGAAATATRRLLLGLGAIGAVVAFGRNPSLRLFMLASIAASCALVVTLAYALPHSLDNRVILGCIDLAGPIQFWKSPVHAPVQTAAFCETDTVTVAGYAWREDSWVAGDRIGPYIISNHFAGAVCLMLPVAMALWLWLTRNRIPGFARGGVAIGMAAVALYAVAVIAKSRAGTASLVLALAAFASLLATTRLARRSTAVITAAGMIAWLTMIAAMHGPLRGIEKLLPHDLQKHLVTLTADGRVWATQLAKRIFVASPVFGTGFGSYYGLSAYLDERQPPWFFAHNDYVQWLAETGCIGGAIAAVLLCGLARRGARFYRVVQPPDRIRDCGCWAALVGIAAHSAFDWNLHVPANAFLASVITGLALSSVSDDATRPGVSAMTNTPWRLAGKLALAGAYVWCFALLCRDAWSDGVQRTMRDTLAAARIAGTAKLPMDDMSRALDAGARARSLDPANAEILLLMGRLHLYAAASSPPGVPLERMADLTAAEECLANARRLSAALRGLPEKQPVATVPPVQTGLKNP